MRIHRLLFIGTVIVSILAACQGVPPAAPLQTDLGEQNVAVVRQVYDAIAARLADFFASPHSIVPRSAFPSLTDRERELLGLIAQGKSNAVIARELDLTPKTVSNYVSNILTKLQVVDRAEAILRAKGAGLG